MIYVEVQSLDIISCQDSNKNLLFNIYRHKVKIDTPIRYDLHDVKVSV